MGNESDSVALFIAIGALVASVASLVIAAASLYLTSLRAAEIEIDHVPKGEEIQVSGFSAEFPGESALVLALVASNTGARGGLLQRFTSTTSRTRVKMRPTGLVRR